jgi:hypothetical protein
MSSYVLSIEPWLVTDSGLQRYPVAANLERQIANRLHAFLSHTYEQQGIVLKRAFPDIFMAKLAAYQSPTGRSFTVSSWTSGVEAMIPPADILTFARDLQTPNELFLRVLWDDAISVVGPLKAVPDVEPIRYDATEFPTEAQLELLSALAPREQEC